MPAYRHPTRHHSDTDYRIAEGAYRDDSVLDELHDLHLPEDDVRTYQQAVRRGDYVVSVNVDDDQVEAVMAAMRRSKNEMYDVDATEEELRTADYVAPTTGALGAMVLGSNDGAAVEGTQV